MERHPLRNTAIGLGLSSAIIGGAILRPDQHIMTADDYFERQAVLTNYPFTYEAVSYLDSIPFYDRHITTNGGGMTHIGDFPYGNWAEVFGNQDEAILHELSHIWYQHMADQYPKFPSELMDAVQKATDQDVEGGYFKHLEWGFGGDWKGIDHSDQTEFYASIASKYMGNVAAMPKPLQNIYRPEFRMDEAAKQIQVNPDTPGHILNFNGDAKK